MPRRAYKRGNPHGGQRPELASLSAGDCIERAHLWPRLAPRCRQPPPCPTRGGSLASRPPTSPLYCKNSLRLSRKWCRIVAPRQIKGRAWRVATSPRPYAGALPSHTIAVCYANPHYSGKPAVLQGACVCICGVGFSIPHRFLFASMGTPNGGREWKYHPQGEYH